jgi:hypothetical protein
MSPTFNFELPRRAFIFRAMNKPILQLDLPGIKKVRSGKVREVFDLGDSFLLVASDRISAFDVIMPNGIPRKGEVLTQFRISGSRNFPRSCRIICSPKRMIRCRKICSRSPRNSRAAR